MLNDGGEIRRDLKCADEDGELSARIDETFNKMIKRNDDVVVLIRVR